jgi:hypothetical protein
MEISQIQIEQNYCHFQDTLYTQEEWLATGTPTSFSPKYITYREHKETSSFTLLNILLCFWLNDILVTTILMAML